MWDKELHDDGIYRTPHKREMVNKGLTSKLWCLKIVIGLKLSNQVGEISPREMISAMSALSP
jgi:hypothetical protein